MDDPAAQPSRLICDVVPVARAWSEWYLRSEIGLSTTWTDSTQTCLSRIGLRDVTSMVGLDGHVNAVLALSFDQSLIDHIAAVMLGSADVTDMDADELREDGAGEVVNMIAGNCAADLYVCGSPLSLTPPATSFATDPICHQKTQTAYTVSFETLQGAVDLLVIGGTPLSNDMTVLTEGNV